MPTSLTKHPALIARDFLVDDTHWDPSNTAGYDAAISDPSDGNFIPVSRGWWGEGETYPFISLTNFGEDVLGGGETGYSAFNGDGSGLVQFRNGTGTITVAAEHRRGSGPYNGESAADIVDLLRREIERIAADEVPYGGSSDLTSFAASLTGESTDTEGSVPVELQSIAVTYNWTRE